MTDRLFVLGDIVDSEVAAFTSWFLSPSKIFLSRLWRRFWKAATLGRMASPEVNVAALGSSGSRGELSEFESLSGVLRGWKKKVGYLHAGPRFSSTNNEILPSPPP